MFWNPRDYLKALKILRPKISQPPTKIVNQSFNEVMFPSKLKIAKVISIFKKVDPEVPSIYRPISLLPISSKIFEKLVYKRIHSFLKEYKLIYPVKFGFRDNYSIDHALNSITEDIRSLQKACDTVSLEILLKTLEHYGIRGVTLKWFHYFLSDHNHFVSIEGRDSTKKEIFHSVQQGLVLGPLLFLISINDLPNVSNKIR